MRDYRGALLGVSASAFALWAIGPWPAGVFQDDGIYVVLAKSLATGEGYRFLNLPGAPAAAHYPPAYPAFLALLWKVWPAFPANLTLFKVANAVLLGVAAWLAYGFARARAGLGARSAVAGVGLFAVCAPLVLLTVMVLSEPLFLVCLFPVLLLCERSAESDSARDAALAGAAVGLLSLVRTLGIFAAPLLLLMLCRRGRWRAALAAAVALGAVLLPWQLWVNAHEAVIHPVLAGKYGSYSGWIAGALREDGPMFLVRVAVHNLRELTALGWASTSTDTLPVAVRLAASAALTAIFFAGLVGLARRAPVTVGFIACYLLVVLVWPFAPARFVWGIWPLVGIAFALGGLELVRSAAAVRWGRPMAVAVVAMLMAGYGVYNVRGTARDWWGMVQGPVAARARPLAAWVVANTDTSAVVATDDDVLVHLYTGRATVPTGAFTPQEHLRPQTPAFATAQLRDLLASYPISFVLASTEFGTYAARGLVQSHPAELRVVTALATGAVFAPVGRKSGL
ncbi:MAG: hypothetical protein ACT4OZ_12695 [Gemmatimonadota bacterium]